MTSPPPTSPVLSLRGRAFRALALVPEAPVADWLGRLDAALARDPGLFQGKVLVLDAGALAAERADLPGLVAALAGRGLRLSGIEGADPRGEAEGHLPPFLPAGHARGEAIEIPLTPPAPPLASLTIEGSVRSGRSIVHPEGDVTVMGAVASGAEILAGGSVHVYGALRGRVIAGAAKNPRARIYCRKFEPELLGIDRLVRTAEDMGNHLRGQAVQIWLDGGAIKIAALG